MFLERPIREDRSLSFFFDIRQSIHHPTFARGEIFTYLYSPGQRAKIHEIIAFCC